MSYDRVFVRLLYSLSINYFLTIKVTSNVKLTPFTYPRLYQIVDRRIGIEYFFKKLGVEGFIYDRLMMKHAEPYLDWQKKFEVEKELLRNIDACALLKTEPRARAYDTIGKGGNRECLKQCIMENKVYYRYLNHELQKLIRTKSYKAEVRLTDCPIDEDVSTLKNSYYKCAKKGYKRYVCECSYRSPVIEASDEFKKTFHEVIEKLYGFTPSPDNFKMLEERYRIPAKLVAFLIACHLLPTEIFTFLVWWETVENPSTHSTTSTTTTASSEESQSVFEKKVTDRRREEAEETKIEEVEEEEEEEEKEEQDEDVNEEKEE